jgi:hypothetical protein
MNIFHLCQMDFFDILKYCATSSTFSCGNVHVMVSMLTNRRSAQVQT